MLIEQMLHAAQNFLKLCHVEYYQLLLVIVGNSQSNDKFCL